MSKVVGVLTGGGDAPGLNAYLLGLTRAADACGVRAVGVRNGLDGLLRPERYPDGGLVVLTNVLSGRDLFEAGSRIGAASGGFPLLGKEYARELVSVLESAGLDALVCVGGEGTHRISLAISRAGFPVVGLPKTIDNDLPGSPTTIGFDSAVEFLAGSLRSLRSHADAHERVMLVETMGRNTGWLALTAAIAGGADAALIPEIPFDETALVAAVAQGARIVVVAEGAYPKGSDIPSSSGLGGVSRALAERLENSTGLPVRSVVPAHLQRAADPVATDRLLGLRLGVAAIERVVSGDTGVLLYWDGVRPRSVPLSETAGVRTVPLDSWDLKTARSLGIFLGD